MRMIVEVAFGIWLDIHLTSEYRVFRLSLAPVAYISSAEHNQDYSSHYICESVQGLNSSFVIEVLSSTATLTTSMWAFYGQHRPGVSMARNVCEHFMVSTGQECQWWGMCSGCSSSIECKRLLDHVQSLIHSLSVKTCSGLNFSRLPHLPSNSKQVSQGLACFVMAWF
jgi:hypothetical protein